MLDRIKKILKANKEISGYVISETMVESNELYFIKKNVDMDRAKSVRHYKVTVYIDFEENGTRYMGSSKTEIHPTMSGAEVRKAIDAIAFAAKFVKNPYYPLAKPAASYRKTESSNFSRESIPYSMNEITKAVYAKDKYEKGGINSCEVFLNRVYTHVMNSECVDADSTDYEGMVEFITSWKEEGEEIELYKCLEFSEFSPELLTEEVDDMVTICKEKAVATNTPAIGKSAVILTREAVKEIFGYYYTQGSGSTVYNQYSTWKVGDMVQGEEVKGDRITLTLDPFMKNSTFSRGFDEDGLALAPVTILENGVLKRYVANTRYAHYLNVGPTGMIRNMRVNGGRYMMDELKKGRYMEIAAFSDFSVDDITGDFGGEIRLAWYHDGEKTITLTGGAISGNLKELQQELYLSKELQKDNNFEGPSAVKLLGVNVGGSST